MAEWPLVFGLSSLFRLPFALCSTLVSLRFFVPAGANTRFYLELLLLLVLSFYI